MTISAPVYPIIGERFDGVTCALFHADTHRPVRPKDALAHRFSNDVFLAIGGIAPSTQEAHGMVHVLSLHGTTVATLIASHCYVYWAEIPLDFRRF